MFQAVVSSLAVAAPAIGNINLEWRPVNQTADLGSEVAVGLYAVSDNEQTQLMAAADVIFGWDPQHLTLIGIDNTGAVPLLISILPVVDPYHLNEAIPPADGDGFYLAYAYLGQPVGATPQGVLLTTFVFQAIAETHDTQVRVLPSGGSPEGHTVVYDGTVPGLDVTGTLGQASVTVRTCGTFDANDDEDVDLEDVAAFQTCFSGSGVPAPALCTCVFDADEDEDLDLDDWAALFAGLSGPDTG